MHEFNNRLHYRALGSLYFDTDEKQIINVSSQLFGLITNIKPSMLRKLKLRAQIYIQLNMLSKQLVPYLEGMPIIC